MHAMCVVLRGRESAGRGQTSLANKHPAGRASAAAGPPARSAGQVPSPGGALRPRCSFYRDFLE